MRLQNSEMKDQLVQRLKRIEGQVRGVQAMLQEERDCREIMQHWQLFIPRCSHHRVFFQEYQRLPGRLEKRWAAAQPDRAKNGARDGGAAG